MTIIRLSKDKYKVTCLDYEFNIYKPSYSQYWTITNSKLHIHRLCDDLSEALDFIDFIMCI